MERTRPRTRAYRPSKTWVSLGGQHEWDQLLAGLIANRLEPATANNYETGWQARGLFRQNNQILDPVPTERSLAMFIGMLAASGYPWKTINNYLSGVGAWMTGSGREAEWRTLRDLPFVNRLREGVLKREGRLGLGRSVRKPALRMEALERANRSIHHDRYNEFLAFTITTFGFYGLCRCGELVSPDAEELQRWGKVLKRHGAHPLADGGGYNVDLSYQKADRFYRGSTIELRRNTTGICPVRILRKYLLWRDTVHGAHPALFVMEDGSLPTRSWFIGELRRLCGEEYCGHSLRAGGATYRAQKGETAVQIMRAGRWRSDTFLIYVRDHPELGEALNIRGTN